MKKSLNTMIRNMDDLKKQSKVMENMKTNKEVKQEGKSPDPIQYVKKNTKN
jgi:hypothetical protein